MTHSKLTETQYIMKFLTFSNLDLNCVWLDWQHFLLGNANLAIDENKITVEPRYYRHSCGS